MTKIVLTALSAAGLMLTLPATAQQSTNVSFAKGTSASTLTGSIKGDQDRSYFIDARAGQTLSLALKATKGSVEMNVYAPGNETAISLGSTDPYKFAGTLPATGRYKVQVYQMRASARRGETASYTLKVGVTGPAASASHDAKVAGTPYSATADIKCTTSVGGKTGACHAGVIRRGGGDATVELKTPDGGQRRIFFTGGRATGSDFEGAFAASRNGDISVVRVGSVEVYEIPDALVVGG